MLYGFLGFEPTPAGFKLQPRLPRDWPEVKLTRVHLHNVVMDVIVKAGGNIVIQPDRVADLPLVIELPKGNWQTKAPGAQMKGNHLTVPLAAERIEISPPR